MSTDEKKSPESWSENALGFGCTAILLFLISLILFAFLAGIAENLGSEEPLTKGHLAGLGFLVLFWGSLVLAYKFISGSGTTFGDRLFAAAMVLVIFVTAFLLLYFQNEISFLDFVGRLRSSFR
jgi:hypothetical protein